MVSAPASCDNGIALCASRSLTQLKQQYGLEPKLQPYMMAQRPPNAPPSTEMVASRPTQRHCRAIFPHHRPPRGLLGEGVCACVRGFV